ncbi:hypothetical protein [Psychromonas ingrahamii]|nr:hypothetical protein [Psychromonas ingrahamii]
MSETVAFLSGLQQQQRKASDLALLFYTFTKQRHYCLWHKETL